MNFETWKGRLGWLAMVAAILISGRLAQADPEPDQETSLIDDLETVRDTALIGDAPADILKSRPWLGLHCFPVEPALRAHVKLPDGQGLVVGSVRPPTVQPRRRAFSPTIFCSRPATSRSRKLPTW